MNVSLRSVQLFRFDSGGRVIGITVDVERALFVGEEEDDVGGIYRRRQETQRDRA